MNKKKPSTEGSNLSELSRLTGVDRAQLRRICVDVKPVRIDGKQKFYLLADIQSKLTNKPNKTLRDEKMVEDIRKVRLYNDKFESKLILKSVVAGAIRRALGGVTQILESKLVNEWPSRVSGISPEDARAYGRILSDDIIAQCQALAKEFPV